MAPDTITAPQSLREHFGEPLHIAVAVEKPQLDKHHRRFIEHSPFIGRNTAVWPGHQRPGKRADDAGAGTEQSGSGISGKPLLKPAPWPI